MDIRDATRMILTESADYPELLRITQHSYEALSAGREVPYTVLNGVLAEASREDVLGTLKERYGEEAVRDMVAALTREIDRQAPVAQR
ncbi:hypothetical protein ACFVH6_38645 [Spirillospora sp. NPDC127200]